MTADHDHAPDIATQRASLKIARALLTGDTPAASEAAAAASCPVCLTLCVMHLGVGLAAEVSGDNGFPVSETLRAKLLAAVATTERDLAVFGN